MGSAMLGINAVKGFEYGEGFDGVTARGSEQNDVFVNINGQISTLTNHSGGIQGYQQRSGHLFPCGFQARGYPTP